MGLFGYLANRSALNQAQENQDEAMRYFQNLPEYQYIEGTAPLLEGMPEEVRAQIIAEDPTLRATEIAALQNAQELAKEGMTAEDAYNYMLGQQRAGSESRGQQEAIINEMQRKGMAGSGVEYALRSLAGQSAVDRFAMEQAAQAAKVAEMKALANAQQQTMAGNIRGEDYRANSANTNILNEFAMNNARNRQAVQAANIERQNAYTANELAQKRAVASGNVDLARQLATQKANIQTGKGNLALESGKNMGNLYDTLGQTGGQAVGSIWDYYTSGKKPEEKTSGDLASKAATSIFG